VSVGRAEGPALGRPQEWARGERGGRPRRCGTMAEDPTEKEHAMSKRARKRRSRKGNAANHGKKPNA
jgi:hypothetical protein